MNIELPMYLLNWINLEDLMKNKFHPGNIPKFKNWMIDGFE